MISRLMLMETVMWTFLIIVTALLFVKGFIFGCRLMLASYALHRLRNGSL